MLLSSFGSQLLIRAPSRTKSMSRHRAGLSFWSGKLRLYTLRLGVTMTSLPAGPLTSVQKYNLGLEEVRISCWASWVSPSGGRKGRWGSRSHFLRLHRFIFQFISLLYDQPELLSEMAGHQGIPLAEEWRRLRGGIKRVEVEAENCKALLFILFCFFPTGCTVFFTTAFSPSHRVWMCRMGHW